MTLAEKRAQLKKEEILRSAMKNIREVGFHRATMEQIAAKLLMTKGSLYYYFKNKEEILYECHKLVLLSAYEAQQEILFENEHVLTSLEKMLDVHIEAVIEEKEFFNLLDDPKETFEEDYLKETLALRKQYQTTFDTLIERGIEQGVFQVNHVFLTRMAMLGALNWIQQWYKADGQLTKVQLKEQFFSMIKKLLI
jgi:AcrR family transcriptional regulator